MPFRTPFTSVRTSWYLGSSTILSSAAWAMSESSLRHISSYLTSSACSLSILQRGERSVVSCGVLCCVPVVTARSLQRASVHATAMTSVATDLYHDNMFRCVQLCNELSDRRPRRYCITRSRITEERGGAVSMDGCWMAESQLTFDPRLASHCRAAASPHWTISHLASRANPPCPQTTGIVGM